jgi:hypothetical protein
MSLEIPSLFAGWYSNAHVRREGRTGSSTMYVGQYLSLGGKDQHGY